MSQPGRSDIDELLDQAREAISAGDRQTANALADQMLAADRARPDTGDQLSIPRGQGEIRRLTILFTDLVDSTELSTRIDPETYWVIVGHYRSEVERIVARHGGHIASTKGDGILAVFGHPVAHEKDAHRAIRTGIDITRSVADLNERARRQFGVGVGVRVGIHRGRVLLDTQQDDVYGFAANFTARICGLAAPGTVAVSAAIRQLVGAAFDFEPLPPQSVKGVPNPVEHFRVIAEADTWRGSRGPLVGRDREVALVEQAWQQALAVDPSTAGIAFAGEAGIGKTRLVTMAADLAAESGVPVLELLGSPFHDSVGLHPVRRLIERRCGITDSAYPAERLRMLTEELHSHGLDPATMVPLLAPVLDIPAHAGYRPVEADARMLAGQIGTAVRDYLTACLDGGPGLVVVEDMHWFDAASTEVIGLLLADPPPRTLVVMTTRDAAKLPGTGNTRVCSVTPLSEAESDELIDALLPTLTDAARGAVRRRCDGVPLYIEEVVHKLKNLAADPDPAQVPDTIYEALLSRLPANDAAMTVVQAAATIGSRVDFEVLRTVLDSGVDDLNPIIDELCAAKVLSPRGDKRWRFRHELLREVAAELAPPSVRRTLHGRVADALITLTADGQPDWPLIAAHFKAAERFGEAATAYQQAAAAARARGALDEARNHLSSALDQVVQQPASARRDRHELALRLRRGFLASAALGSNNSDTAADFERCLELGGSDLSNDDLFATLMALFTHFVSRGDLRRAEQVVHTLRVAVDHGREWWLAENVGGHGVLAWNHGEFETARDLLAQSVELMACREHRDVESVWFVPFDPVVSTYTQFATVHWVLGDCTARDAALADARRRVDALPFPQGPFSASYVDFIQCLMALDAGDQPTAAHWAETMTERARKHGFDASAAAGFVLQQSAAAMALIQTHPVDTAALAPILPILLQWLDLCRAIEIKTWLLPSDAVAARLLIAIGELEQARQCIDAGLTLSGETRMNYYDAELLRLRAQTHHSVDARRTDLTAALNVARKQHATIFELRIARDLVAVGDDSAREVLAEAVSRFPADSSWPELAAARASLAE